MPDNDIPELVTIESPDLDDLDITLVPVLDVPMRADETVAQAGYTSIPRCFAYNQQMQRCDLNAGHYGFHAVANEWNDDECFDPAQGAVAIRATLGPPVPAFGPEPAAAPSEPCVVCNHHQSKHGGEDGCVGKSPDGDMCNCREFV